MEFTETTVTSASEVGPLFLIGLGLNIIFVLLSLLSIVSLWILFSRKNEPGWAAIVPIYDIFIITRIAGLPGWWVILLFIPVINFILSIYISIKFVQAYGYNALNSILITLFPFVGYPVMAFMGKK